MSDTMNFGMGQAFQGVPRDAMRLMESQQRYQQARIDAKRKAAADAEDTDNKNFNKVMEEDFKVDNSKYHRKVLPLATQASKATMEQLISLRQRNPHNWQSQLGPVMADYKQHLGELMQQSTQFFDYEKQDRSKFNVDEKVLQALNSNPGDLTDLQQLTQQSRGLKGYDIGKDGFWYHAPVPKIDQQKMFNDFKKGKGAFDPSSAGYSSTGVRGIVNLRTLNTPNKDLVQGLRTDLHDNAVFQADLAFNAKPEDIPDDVDTRNPESLAQWTRGLVDKAVNDNIKPYYTLHEHNVPKKGKEEAAASTGSLVRSAGGYSYRNGQSNWDLTYDKGRNKYFLSVRTLNEKGEPTDNKEMDWAMRTDKGDSYVMKGRLLGFYYDETKNSLQQVITSEEKTRSEKDGLITTATSRKFTPIGWDVLSRQVVEGEYKNNPIDVLKELYKANFNKELPRTVNDPAWTPDSSPVAKQTTEPDDQDKKKRIKEKGKKFNYTD